MERALIGALVSEPWHAAHVAEAFHGVCRRRGSVPSRYAPESGGTLFIGLTFLAFIVFEMGLGARLHPVQYGIVGLSMVVFYLVLLSLSEHLAFLTSYLSASGCIVLMVSCYVGFALRNYKEGIGIGVLLVALYSLLYTILQMEDYALLMGTALLLVMLAALMVVSRNLARGNK